MDKLTFNRLKYEKSNYLLEHKDNPIHWWAFGPDAIQRAKDEGKPIFLSIGYSTCHVCSTMNRESFASQEIANILNELFICIKVDGEEHPDIDSYYQAASHYFIKTGGWPISAFLLPNMQPYFVGTYYPPFTEEGQASFKELLLELSRAFFEDFDQVQSNANTVAKAIDEGLYPKDKVEYQGHFPPPMAILDAIKEFRDVENGGYGAAPKIPNFPFHEWAVEHILEGMIEEGPLREHVIFSLERMLLGPLHDHARGGIHNYCVDSKWMIPNFEKLLCNQADFIRVLAKFGLIYPSPLVFDALINTLDFLEVEMRGEDGYFFTGQDAESEEVEGLYYTFTKQEFESAVKKASPEGQKYAKEMKKFKTWFCITDEGNYLSNLNVISLDHKHLKEIFTAEGWEQIRRIRAAIVEERKGRMPPKTDNKGVASWNFMMLSALCEVIQYCKIDIIKQMARTLIDNSQNSIYKTFITDYDSDHFSIRHSTTKPNHVDYFEDYVTFANCQLRLYEVTGEEVLKEKFKIAMQYIAKEFVEDGKLYTRSLSNTDFELYPNQEVDYFDARFRSVASTYIELLRRGEILFQDSDFSDVLVLLREHLTHKALKSPHDSGEALRALSYPDEIYRVLKIPKSWCAVDKFTNFMTYFLPRFVFDYHTEENDNWQICNMKACELQGDSLESFLEIIKTS
ncbi:MAG: thioredoxin domain-containing protein [Bacteriovoracaceae bacterium]|nr:thioredoxin domain-containing protein [Bacteriovoracaceae bacterium]